MPASKQNILSPTKAQLWAGILNTLATPSAGYDGDTSGFPTLEKIRELDGRKIENILKDYEVAMFTDGGRGTAWILDFEMKDDDSYPTKFFFATNWHVVSHFNFSGNYKPEKEDKDELAEEDANEVHILNSPADAIYKSKTMVLVRDMRQDTPYVPYSDYPEMLHNDLIHDNLSNKYEIRDAKDPYKTPVIGKTLIYKTHIKDPKLLFAAGDFLKEAPNYALSKPTDHYYKDFAVVEVDFENEQVARLMTKDFYYRYYLNHVLEKVVESQYSDIPDSDPFKPHIKEYMKILKLVNNRYRPINFFSDLQSKVPADQKEKFLIPYGNYFTGGYSKDAYNLFNFLGNYSPIREQSISPFFGEKYRNVNKFWSQPWFSEDGSKKDRATSLGVNYSFVNVASGKGASGSLVVNKDLDVLGLFRTSKTIWLNNPFKYSNVEGIRSNVISDKDGKVISPSYDLLESVSNQANSYSTALLKKYPNMNTYLRQLRGWDTNR